MNQETLTANAPEPVVPSWPTYMPVRPSRPIVDLVCFLVIVALLVGAAVLYSAPWHTAGRVGGADLARYVPDVDGTTSLFEVRDGQDNVSGYEGQNADKVVSAEVFLALPSAVREPVLAGAAADEAAARDFTADAVAKFANLDSSISALEHAEVFQIRQTDLVDGQPAPQRSTTFEVRGPQGVFTAGLLGTDGSILSFSPPLLSVPAQLDDGHSWKSSGTFGFQPYTYEAQVSGHAGTDTPLGHLDDCVTIEGTTVIGAPPDATTFRATATYCAGVGLVDSRSTTDRTGSSTVRHDVLVRTTQRPGGAGVTLPAVPGGTGDESLSSPDAWGLTRFARTATTGTSIGATTAPTFVPVATPLVVVPDENGDVVAYDAKTRIELWRFHAGGAVFGQPTFDADSGTLVFGASDRRVYAVDANGTFKWAFRTGDNVAGRPIVIDGVVVAGSEDKNVYGLDVTDGRERWKAADTAAIASSPVEVNGLAVIGDDDGNVLAIDPHTGDTMWSGNLPGAAEGPVTTDGSSVFVGSQGDELNFGAVTALDAATGEQRWSTRIDNASRAAVAPGDSLVFAVDDTGILYALDRQTGLLAWSTRSLYAGTPFAVGDDAIAVRSDGTVDVFAPDGDIIRSFEARAAIAPQDEEPSVNLGLTEGGGALWFTDTNALVFRLGPTDPSAPPALEPRFVDTSQAPGLDHGPLIATPVEHDGQVIVVDGLGGIVSVDPATGATHSLGEYDTANGAVRTEPVVAGDLVLTMIGPDLQAFDLTTGTLKWTASGGGGAALSGQVASATTAYFVTADLDADGNLEFDTNSGQLLSTLRAVDLESGDTRWTAPVESVQGVGISVAGDEVVAAGAPLTAFDGQTGAVRWTAPDVVRSQGAPAFDDADNLVMAVASDEVVAVDATSGAVRWRSPITAQVVLDTGQPVFIDDGVVVVATASPGPILGFDARTGAPSWSFTAPGPRYGTVVSAGGATYVVLTDGSVLALSSNTGKIIGSSNVVSATLAAFGQSVARPAVVGDTVIVEAGAFLIGLTPAVVK